MKYLKKAFIPIILIWIIVWLIAAIYSVFQKPQPQQELVNINAEKGYVVDMLSETTNVQPGVLTHLRFKIKNSNDEPVRNFQVVHGQLLHVAVVRNDLQDFQLLQPVYDNETGEFSVDVTFNKPGAYMLYADFTPARFENNLNNEYAVASFPIMIGKKGHYNRENVQVNQDAVQKVQDYTITYQLPAGEERKAETEMPISLTIQKNDSAVVLQPYLAQKAHSFIINAKTLEYVHAYAENSEPGAVSFTTNVPRTGTYKMFTLFEHDGEVVTTEYVFEVR